MHRLLPQDATVLELIARAGSVAGCLTVDRIVGQCGGHVSRVRDLLKVGCFELCDHPSERDLLGQPACAVRITDKGRVALTRMHGSRWATG